MLELLLVSQSPRRKLLLENAGFLFRVHTVKISETIGENVNVARAIMELAKTKGEFFLNEHKALKGHNFLLLSADTMVVLNGRALGKPKNSTEAQQFLRLLSGQTHEVITAIYLKNLQNDDEFLGYDTTKVLFKSLSDGEIADYVAGGEPMDKAGAYAIQGDGGRFVQSVQGSKSNVIGLPIELFEKVLAEKSWHVSRRESQPSTK